LTARGLRFVAGQGNGNGNGNGNGKSEMREMIIQLAQAAG
jgi:hypothetical protein